jgi:hypothetical protein
MSADIMIVYMIAIKDLKDPRDQITCVFIERTGPCEGEQSLATETLPVESQWPQDCSHEVLKCTEHSMTLYLTATAIGL